MILVMGKDNSYAISTEAEIEDFLETNKDWTYVEDRLKAEFELPTFGVAVTILNQVFAAAARLDHHPRVTNTYNRLEFSLCTHGVGN